MNKIERLKAAINGELPDKVPAGFWFHFPSSYGVKELIDGHIELYKHTDMDIIKVMYEFGYSLTEQVSKPSDWYKIKPEGKTSTYYKKQKDVIKGIVDKVQGDVMVFTTMFGPFKSAVMAYGDDLVMAHSKEDPEAVAAGVNTIAEALVEWAEGYLEAGADGIYYSAQFAELGRFTYDEWSKLVRPSDLKVLNVADKKEDKYNILHICGEPEYKFKTHVDRFYDYSGDIVNWAVYDNNYELERGRDLFKRTILGGLDNRGVIINGTFDEITDEVHNVIRKFGKRGLMIGADCTLPGDIDPDRIKVAVEACASFEQDA